MTLRKLLLTNNECYKTGKRMTPKGIVVHSTGCNNPRLSRYIGPDDGILGPASPIHWNTLRPDGRQVCVHAFIGKVKDGSIATYQTLPWDMRGWHGGKGPKGSVNNDYIGFEICEAALNDAAYFNATYLEAVELCAMLCAEYFIAPNKPFLICHSEGYKLGMASNHADVMHWFPKHGKSMDTFRADVKTLLSTEGGAELITQPTQQRPPVGQTAAYQVRLTAAEIRSRPDDKSPKVGVITDKGVYTIVDTQHGPGSKSGWGLLKSYAAKRNGWISLDLTQRA
jgi:hypothetical protein